MTIETELKLDLKGCTPRQYAALILREDLDYTYQRAGRILGISRYAFAILYKRAQDKPNTRYAHRNILLLRQET